MLFDAVYIPGGEESIKALKRTGRRWCFCRKPISIARPSLPMVPGYRFVRAAHVAFDKMASLYKGATRNRGREALTKALSPAGTSSR